MTHTPNSSHDGRQHEPATASVRGILITGLGLALLVALSLVSMESLVKWLDPAPMPAGEPTSSAEPPPRTVLSARQHMDLQAYLQREHARLNSYGWVDQATNIARIPIDRAMKLLEERGGRQP